MPDSGFARFRALSARGNVVPVWRELSADCVTPVMAMLSLRSKRSFLLESVEGGERLARYSFLGRDPWLVVSAAHGAIREESNGNRVRSVGEILPRLKERFAAFRPATVAGLPRFTGGAVGWMSWEAALGSDEARGESSRGDLPDAWFGFYDTILAFDHLRQALLLITSARTDEAGDPLQRQYREAIGRLDRLSADLDRGMSRTARSRERRHRPEANGHPPTLRAVPGRRRWRTMVERAREHISAGDLYQIVLSRRFEGTLSGDPFEVYRALRRINPSPYMFYLKDGATVLAGASPEMLARVEGDFVEIHPIARTRPRGKDTAADLALASELSSNPKERAEHVMLLDLGRNDLGRVCAPGSVQVPEVMSVQRFSHVMHLVSRVTGTLAPGMNAFDALAAVFPAGTVSGAPKVRAMQIIGQLERGKRGPYAGAACYFDYSGNLDSCIIIRTLVARGRVASIQAGAGIVADSDPDFEFEETNNKAGAMIAAVMGAGRCPN